MADSELADLRKQCMASLYSCTENVLKYLDEEKESELAKLKTCVREYCSMEAMQVLESEALVMASRETDVSSVNLLEDKYKDFLSNLQTHRRQNIDNHPFMQEFDKIVRNRQLNNSQNLDESDLVITETQEPLLDPITKKPIEDPVRNTICNHVYERAAIYNHIQSRQGQNRARCPVAGCGNREPVQMSCLVADEAVRARIQASASTPRARFDLDDMDSQ